MDRNELFFIIRNLLERTDKVLNPFRDLFIIHAWFNKHVKWDYNYAGLFEIYVYYFRLLSLICEYFCCEFTGILIKIDTYCIFTGFSLNRLIKILREWQKGFFNNIYYLNQLFDLFTIFVMSKLNWSVESTFKILNLKHSEILSNFRDYLK